MEIIQWFTNPVNKDTGKDILTRDNTKYTKHAMFRLDSLDKEVLETISPGVYRELVNNQIKAEAELGLKHNTNGLVLRVSEENLHMYQTECLVQFAIILGLIKPGENIKELSDKIK